MEPVYFSLNRSLACAPWTTSLTEALPQSCKVSCLFSIYRLFSPFHFYRLELNGEPLNCPVDRNTLIRDKVGDLLHCRSYHHAVLTGSWPGAVPEPAYFLVFSTHWLILKFQISQSRPDTAVSLVSTFRAGHCLFYRQFISTKKRGGGTIFSWGFLICTTATTASLTAVKYIHKTYRLLTFSKLKLFEIGSVGGATYKLDKS